MYGKVKIRSKEAFYRLPAALDSYITLSEELDHCFIKKADIMLSTKELKTSRQNGDSKTEVALKKKMYRHYYIS